MKQVIASLCFLCCASSVFGEETAKRVTAIAAMSGHLFPASASQILRSAKFQLPQTGEFDISTEFPRGIGLGVYPKAAPAIVLLRTPGGSGTGFVLELDDRRWLITNNHVIEDSAIDIKSVTGIVEVRTGALDDGEMRLSPDPLEAVVYKADERRDLALLRLKQPLPHLSKGIKLAAKAPKPGADCVAIGHPTRGALWTLRTGTISATGRFPQEFTDLVVVALSVADDRKAEIASELQRLPSRNVVLSTCGINPGDSGGPLLNERAELVAVTFATPRGEDGRDLNRFTYHVHLDEVRGFLEELPKEPEQRIPDPMPAGTTFKVIDGDDDKKFDALVVYNKENAVVGVLFDLDQDSPVQKEEEFDLALWDWELSLHLIGGVKAFYDADNDGKFDRVRLQTDITGTVDELTLSAKIWTGQRQQGEVLDLSLFQASELRKRAEQLISKTND